MKRVLFKRNARIEQIYLNYKSYKFEFCQKTTLWRPLVWLAVKRVEVCKRRRASIKIVAPPRKATQRRDWRFGRVRRRSAPLGGATNRLSTQLGLAS